LKAPNPTIARVIGTYRAWDVDRIDVEDVLAALSTAEGSMISFWDALVVVSAARAGASRLYPEDLNDGQVISGVRIVNPLVWAPLG
jgi:predicted nucleic acid-binding protein